jgi:hypothetical protein
MMVPEAERVRVAAVARITSLSPRKVQELAVAGRLPSAAASGGDVSRLPDVSIDEAYARLIPAKRRGAYVAGGSNLSARR